MSVTGDPPPADALRAVAARPRRRQDPAPAEGRARPDPGRRPRGPRRPRCPSSTSPRSSATTSTCSQLNYAVDTGFYPLGSCTMKYNPKLNEWAARLPGFAGAPSARARRDRPGHARSCSWELEEALAEISGMRAVTLQPAAGAQGELTGILMIRAYHRARGDVERTEVLVPDIVARHEPGDRVDGRLHDGHHPVGAGRRRRPRRVPGRARAADGRRDDHEPLDARAVRGADRRAPRRGPRGRRAGLHGRRQPERDPRPVQARRGRLRRHALQRPQDVHHAARRRRARAPGRSASARSSLPFLPAPRVLRERGRHVPPRAARRAADVDRADALASSATPASSSGPTPTSGPTARPGCARSATTRSSRPTTSSTALAGTYDDPVRQPGLQARVRRLGGDAQEGRPACARSTSPSGSSTTASTRRRSTSR